MILGLILYYISIAVRNMAKRKMPWDDSDDESNINDDGDAINFEHAPWRDDGDNLGAACARGAANDSDVSEDHDDDTAQLDWFTVDCGGGSSDDDAGEDAEDNVIKFVTSLLLMRVLFAKMFCTLMYYLGLAGLNKCKKLGLGPTTRNGRETPSGHYNRKVRSNYYTTLWQRRLLHHSCTRSCSERTGPEDAGYLGISTPRSCRQ